MKKKRAVRVAVIVVLAILCFVGFLLSPIFRIQAITVNGCTYYSEEEITEALQEVSNKNYFTVLFSDVPFAHIDYLFKGRLYTQEQNLVTEKPYIKTAKITYQFPDRLEVLVTERSPSFLTKFEGEYLLVDNEGYVLEVFSEEKKPLYPIVEGLDLNGYKMGGSLRTQGSREPLELAIKICSLMEQAQFLEGYIDIIDLSDPEGIWMYASPSLAVKLGDSSDIAMKLSILKGIFQSGYNGDSNGVIDFTSGKNPIFQKNETNVEDNS